MADEPEVTIEVRPDGTVRFEVSGVSGVDCEAVEQLVLAALRGDVVERERTSEYYARAASGEVAAKLRQRQKR